MTGQYIHTHTCIYPGCKEKILAEHGRKYCPEHAIEARRKRWRLNVKRQRLKTKPQKKVEPLPKSRFTIPDGRAQPTGLCICQEPLYWDVWREP